MCPLAALISPVVWRSIRSVPAITVLRPNACASFMIEAARPRGTSLKSSKISPKDRPLLRPERPLKDGREPQLCARPSRKTGRHGRETATHGAHPSKGQHSLLTVSGDFHPALRVGCKGIEGNSNVEWGADQAGTRQRESDGVRHAKREEEEKWDEPREWRGI